MILFKKILSSLCWVYATFTTLASQGVFAARFESNIIKPSARGRQRSLPQQMVQTGQAAASKLIQTATAESKPFQSLWGGVRFLFSLPPDLKPGASPRGLFIMLHGCQRTADSFFTLPEETAMTASVLRRGYAVAAPDQVIRRAGDCWEINTDGNTIARAIPEAQVNLGLQKAPLYSVGVSSGGMLLARLVSHFRLSFSGVIFNVSPHDPYMFSGKNPWPRTSFVYSQGDHWAPPNTVNVAAKLLQQRGTPVQLLSVGPKALEELPRHAAKLGMLPQTLSLAVDLLRKAGFAKALPGPTIGSSKGSFLAPQATDPAVDYLKTTAIANAIASHGEGLREEMHILAGIHGPTSEHFEKVLDFVFEQNSRPTATAVNSTIR